MSGTGTGLAEGSAAPAPDVLVIVMDCVRASDFPGGASDAPEMPFVDALRKKAVSFPQAISVAPWTLPSHASMFTGLYPWEHGCHGRGSLVLDPRFERLAATLRTAGYRTASFSGNPIISPFYGLTEGFEVSEWGEWWEQVHRVRSRPYHSYRLLTGTTAPSVPELSFRDRSGRAIKTMMTRYPATLALSDAVQRRIVDPNRALSGSMNPWIEPNLSTWLAAQPERTPTFVFVNTIDAHEPYLLDPEDAPTLGAWWRDMRVPQDVLALLASETPPSSDDLGRLHSLYRSSIARLDRRLERLVRVYRDAGRWENTLLVLTSDHGQAFGEHGMIWHGVRTDEEMLRVPLVVRFPRDELGGTTGKGWASPMDIPATVLEAANLTPAGSLSSRSLHRLVSEARSEPLLAAGDGTEWNRPFMQQLSDRRRSELNLFSIAAYQGATKVVVDATSDACIVYRLTGRGLEESPASDARGPEIEGLIRVARQAGRELLHPVSAGVGTAVDERLRSWGYG